MATALLLGAAGLFLSGFFSGAETGFYRAARLRLMLDALEGDWMARGLVWLTNNPALFVATTLVGNNLANYLVSLAVVLGTQAVFTGPGYAPELLAPIVFAPLLFVYGELLPKKLFLNAPNRLLRAGGPLFLAAGVLFLPVSVLLWGLSRLMARLVGESHEQIRLRLGQRELKRVLDEGHEAGILHPAQRSLVQGLFALAGHMVVQYAVPLEEVPRVGRGATKEEALNAARRHGLGVIPVAEGGGEGRLVGYVRTIELALRDTDELSPLRPLIDVPSRETHLGALIRMETADEDIARVVDAEGDTVGMVTLLALREPLFRGGGGAEKKAPTIHGTLP